MSARKTKKKSSAGRKTARTSGEVVVTARFPADVARRLDRLAKTRGVSRSELVRAAVEQALRRWKKGEGPLPKSRPTLEELAEEVADLRARVQELERAE